MALERTLSIIKPDAVAKNVVGEIYSRFEKAGLKIVACKMKHLSRKEAEVKQALAQLSADMVKTGEPYRTVKLNDGSTVSASFNEDKSVFTVQDSAAYNSQGKFGEWVSVHTPSGSLRLNTVAPADHVSPGPALRDALANTAGVALGLSLSFTPAATLLLRPFNFNTLSTRVYELASLERIGEAAPAALVVVAMGLAAVALLARATKNS